LLAERRRGWRRPNGEGGRRCGRRSWCCCADKNAKRALRKAKTGPKGDTGLAGPRGDRGAPGAPGASGATGGAASSTSVPIAWSTNEQTVRSFSLPAGKYVFNATAFGHNTDDNSDQSFGCRIVAGSVNIAQNTALILGPQTGGIDHASSRGPTR
jgi:hypothetical protein